MIRRGSADVILLVILIILVCAVGAYLLYTNNQNLQNSNTQYSSNESKEIVSETKNANINANTQQKNTNESIKKDLNIASEEVKKLYDYIPCISGYVGTKENSAYNSSTVYINNISKEEIIRLGFEKMNLNEGQKGDYVDASGNVIEYNGNPGDWYSFDAEILMRKLKEMYNKEFEKVDIKGLSYSDGRYNYSSFGGGSGFISNLRKIEKAYEENDNLYIIDKYLCMYYGIDEEDLSSGKNIARLYSNSYNQDSILKEIDVTELQNLSRDEYADYIMSKYGDMSSSYIHTYRKNASGDYYWYSTEPLK
ncbi:MAG: hypothetical protein IJ809_06455 [Clostridia bacterium]|nr:hypothetical protein [Clostridia bacterium]